MNLAAIVAYTTAKLGVDDLAARDRAKLFAAGRWGMIWNHTLWRQSRTSATVALPANTQEMTLPAEIDLVHAVRIGGDRMLEGSHDLDALWLDPAGRDQPGMTASFMVIGKDASGLTRLRLHRPSDQASTLLVLGKTPAPALSADTDTPMGIPGIDECLVAYVLGDLNQWMRQFSKADRYYQEANALLAKAVEIETMQQAETRRMIPYVQQLEGDESLPGWLS